MLNYNNPHEKQGAGWWGINAVKAREEMQQITQRSLKEMGN